MGFLNIQPFIKDKFDIEFDSNLILKKYLEDNMLTVDRLLAYGKTSWIVVVRNRDKLFAVKLQRKDAYRESAIENEYRFLKLVNQSGIGQKVIYYDKDGKFILWEFVDALPLRMWLKSATKEMIAKCIRESLEQAKILDGLGIDHSQLAGAGTNIIVKKDGTPMIVDFEKASLNRKSHNYNVLINYFNKLEK